MTETRYRLVTEQGGEQHVSGLVLADDEIREALELEITLHRSGGWEVDDFGQILRFQKNGTVRWVWVRSRSPLEDTL